MEVDDGPAKKDAKPNGQQAPGWEMIKAIVPLHEAIVNMTQQHPVVLSDVPIEGDKEKQLRKLLTEVHPEPKKNPRVPQQAAIQALHLEKM